MEITLLFSYEQNKSRRYCCSQILEYGDDQGLGLGLGLISTQRHAPPRSRGIL